MDQRTIDQYSAAVEERGVGAIWLLPIYLATLVAVALLLAAAGPEEIRATVILLVLTPLTFIIFARAARADVDGAFLYRVLLLAWPAKLASMGFKLYLMFNVLGGSDAVGYHKAGKAIAGLLASGGLPEMVRFSSTAVVELITGIFYFVVTGPTFVGAWIFWSWLGTMGMLAHYKAFTTALPNSSRRWFALLIFFSPTILMWSNALGKDALIAFALGLASYGVALAYRRGLGLGSLLWIAAGLGLALVVRPHIAAMASVGLVVAGVLRPVRAGMLTPLVRLGIIVGVIIFAITVVRLSASYLSVELTVDSVEEFYETQALQTQQGNLAFEGSGAIPTTPSAIGQAIVTVLFRPFPWEAAGLLASGIALEGMLMAALLLYRWRSVVQAIWEGRRHAYLGFVAAYSLIFIIAFSAVLNFGILARQRAQVLPFIFVLIAYQGWRGSRGPVDAPA